MKLYSSSRIQPQATHKTTTETKTPNLSRFAMRFWAKDSLPKIGQSIRFDEQRIKSTTRRVDEIPSFFWCCLFVFVCEFILLPYVSSATGSGPWGDWRVRGYIHIYWGETTGLVSLSLHHKDSHFLSKI